MVSIAGCRNSLQHFQASTRADCSKLTPHNTLESHYKMSSLDEVEIKVENFAIDIADYERCYHEEGPSGAMLDRRAGLTNYWSQIKFELAANGLNAMILSPNIRDHKSGSADGNSDGYYPQ